MKIIIQKMLKHDTKGKEVFNIRDNIFTFKEAQAVCKAHDAESQLLSK